MTQPPMLGERLSVAPPPNRVTRLLAWMRDAAVDTCVLAGADHVVHLTGYTRYCAGPAAVVLDCDGKRTLIVNVKEAEAARAFSEVDEVVGCGMDGLGFELDPLPGLIEAIAATPSVRASSRIGLAGDVGLAGAVTTPIVDAETAVAAIRRVHDEDELALLLRAYELAWRAQAAVGELAAPGVTEIELFSAAHGAAQNAHGAPVEFVADLLSGTDTARAGAPMHVPGARPIEEGDPVLADIVVGAAGYWGDTAETYLTGESAEVAEVRQALLEIRAACAAELRPGAMASEIFQMMNDHLRSRFPEGTMPHHAGHGVGLSSFDHPHLIPTESMPLENWMLIALEPGVYINGRYGVRVENLYIVTPLGGVELRAAMGVA